MKRKDANGNIGTKPLRKRSYLQKMRRKIDPLVKEFKTRFQDETSCWQYLLDSLLLLGMIVCGRCKGQSFTLHCESKKGICNFCGQARSITAGTFFHKVKKLPEWMLAIWLIENGAVISANAFAGLFGLAQSSCWHIFQSVYAACDINNLNRDPLLSSNHFRAIFLRRSLETPRAEHPICEEKVLQEERSNAQSKRTKTKRDEDLGEVNSSVFQSQEEELQMPTAEQYELTDDSKTVFNALKGEALSVDELCKKTDLPAAEVLTIVSILEMREIIKSLAGFKFKVNLVPVRKSPSLSKPEYTSRIPMCLNLFCKACNEQKLSDAIEESITDFQMRICQISHGISRKYLRRYLAARKFIVKALSRRKLEFVKRPELPNICLLAGYIGRDKIKKTRTDLLVDWDLPAAG